MLRCLIEHFMESSVSCEYLDNEERQVRSRDSDIHQDMGQITLRSRPGSQSFRTISQSLTTSDSPDYHTHLTSVPASSLPSRPHHRYLQPEVY